ncbi:MAG: FAD binding domain-containing protein, partial [Hyphomicrobiaceae bacterium]
MEALPEFELVSPATLGEMLAARQAHPGARLLGGGTDLVVNIRRGIEAPPMLIETGRVAELRAIEADANGLQIGASITLEEISRHPGVAAHFPVVAQAAASIAGPTHRSMGTLGGNLCLDT